MNLQSSLRCLPVLCLTATLATSAPAPAAKAPKHDMVQGDAIVWGPGPPALPKGARSALLSGDPSQAGAYTLRAEMPAGYKIPAHWHPTDEHVTVLSGTFAMGMGEAFDEAALMDLKPGAYARMPANERHFAIARTAVVIQVHGIGPFQLTYVNPKDDPRTAVAK